MKWVVDQVGDLVNLANVEYICIGEVGENETYEVAVTLKEDATIILFRGPKEKAEVFFEGLKEYVGAFDAPRS